MRKTMVICGDGSRVTLEWTDTKEKIERFIFEYYRKTVDKIIVREYN